MFEGFLSSPAGAQMNAPVFDVCTHEADLRQALGLPVEYPVDMVEFSAEQMLAGFAEQVADAGLPAVEVSGPPFEVFRGRLGRRTAEEVAALEWSSSPEAYLDSWFIFGRRAESLSEA